MKYAGTRYNSRWDASTWAIIAVVVAACYWPIFIEGDKWPMLLITTPLLIFVLIGFIGTYYRIDGDKLVVYQFFRPTAYPIDKIAEISPTKTILTSPANSLTHRIAIRFSDRKVLKSSIPLVISPVRQEEFITRLTAINPEIKYNGD